MIACLAELSMGHMLADRQATLVERAPVIVTVCSGDPAGGEEGQQAQ